MRRFLKRFIELNNFEFVEYLLKIDYLREGLTKKELVGYAISIEMKEETKKYLSRKEE